MSCGMHLKQALEAAKNSPSICPYCHRIITDNHKTYFYDARSNYKRNVVVCTDITTNLMEKPTKIKMVHYV